MFLNHENLHLLSIKKEKLSLIFELFIVGLIVTYVFFYHSIFLMTNSGVYAEEILIPVLTYHNFTTEE